VLRRSAGWTRRAVASARRTVGYREQGTNIHASPSFAFHSPSRDWPQRLANARYSIARLPCGPATLVDERRVKLSRGERQRVASPRTFLSGAPILMLDEARSSLDSESEALTQEAIKRLLAG
jgi:ABC-type multidrug transport system ATPase subunit